MHRSRAGLRRLQDRRVRLIAATNRDLQARVHAGQFREDLLYRRTWSPCKSPRCASAPKTSDGDVVALNEFIKYGLEAAGGRYKVDRVRFSMGNIQVEYDAVSFEQITDFAEVKYKSVGADREIADAFIADGGHPFDVLKGED